MQNAKRIPAFSEGERRAEAEERSMKGKPIVRLPRWRIGVTGSHLEAQPPQDGRSTLKSKKKRKNPPRLKVLNKPAEFERKSNGLAVDV